MNTYDIVKLTAIIIDNHGQWIPPPFFNMDIDGNPFLKNMYDQLVRPYAFNVYYENHEGTLLCGMLPQLPSEDELKELNSMGVWVLHRTQE